MTDLTGFKIYYGTSSGSYSNVTDVGNVTSYTVANLSTGTYYFAVTAYDTAGVESAYSNEVVLTPPPPAPVSSAVTDPVNGAMINTASYTIRGTATTGASKVEVGITASGATVWYPATGTTSWSYSWSPASDGTYTVTSKATDASGSVEVPGPGVSVTVDRGKPSSSITAPAASSSISRSSSNCYIVGTATDPVSGVKKVEVSTDGGTTWSAATGTSSWSYVWTLPSTDGSYSIMSRATDNAGNVETPGAGITVTVSNPSPTSAITYPANHASINSARVVISGTATNDGYGIRKVEVSINHGIWRLASGTSVWSYTWTPVSDGTYSIRSRATDDSGKVESPITSKIVVKIDRTAPTVFIWRTFNGVNLPGTLVSYSIKGNAKESIYGSGLDKVWVSTDGGLNWAEATRTISFTASGMMVTRWVYDWTPTADGTYVIKARARDLAGNIRGMRGPTVKVDRTPPVATITAPVNGATRTGTYMYIKGTATDNGGSGLRRVAVSTDGGKTWAVATGTTSWYYYWKLPPNGAYNIKARARDWSDNFQDPGAGITVKVAH